MVVIFDEKHQECHQKLQMKKKNSKLCPQSLVKLVEGTRVSTSRMANDRTIVLGRLSANSSYFGVCLATITTNTSKLTAVFVATILISSANSHGGTTNCNRPILLAPWARLSARGRSRPRAHRSWVRSPGSIPPGLPHRPATRGQRHISSTAT